MKKILCIISLLSLTILPVGTGVVLTAQETTAPVTETAEVSGEISSINTEENTFVIRQVLDEVNGTYEDMVFMVDETTVIQKGYKAVTIADLALKDKVTVEYVVNEQGVNAAKYVWVEEK